MLSTHPEAEVLTHDELRERSREGLTRVVKQMFSSLGIPLGDEAISSLVELLEVMIPGYENLTPEQSAVIVERLELSAHRMSDLIISILTDQQDGYPPNRERIRRMVVQLLGGVPGGVDLSAL